jgi:hypothetical protein
MSFDLGMKVGALSLRECQSYFIWVDGIVKDDVKEAEHKVFSAWAV